MAAAAFTSSSGIGPLPRFLEAAGGPHMVARVFQAENLPVSAASGDVNWIPLSTLMSLFERAAAEVGDDLFGLHVGQAMRPEDFGLWARYATSAPNLGGMILRANRALRFHQSGGALSLDVQDDVAVWSYRVADPAVFGRRHHAEHAVWPMLAALRRYTNGSFRPIRIECSYERPRCWRRLEEAFAIPMVFGKAANAIVFERRLLDKSAACATPLCTNLTYGDLRRMARRQPPTTIVEAARAIVEVRIAEPLTDIDGTALLLGISPRSLQRHLLEENLTFRDLLEQVRMQRALDLLKETPASIIEIAFALGYNDATSFSRAFRRWAGYPPSQVRRPSPERP